MFICTTGFVHADNHEKEVKTKDLPHGIQQFINSHFSGTSITRACTSERGKHKIQLTNGYEVEFDHNGKWDEIDNELHAALPSSVISLLPITAVNYIAQNYPNQAIYSIDREDNGYEVKIHGTQIHKLFFDRNGNLLRHEMED